MLCWLKAMVKSTQQNYTDFIGRKIGQKFRKLARKSILLGQTRAEEDMTNFVQDVERGLVSLLRVKVECVVGLAGEIVARQLEAHPDTIVAMLKKVFRNVAEHTDVEVTAHPLDIMQIKSAINEGGFAHASARQIALKEDETFQRGSLTIKANKSIIDAHVKTQLEKAKILLIEGLEGSYGKAG